MGSQPSRPATASPSAAFGRLRISSPHASSIRAQRASMEGRRLERLATESSPLIPPSRPAKLQTLESTDSASSPSSSSSPPVVVWIGPALICALMYALYNIFIKKGSASIHPVLGGVILQFVAALLGCALLSALVVRDGGWQDMDYDRAGITWAIWAGAAVGAAEILSFVVSGMGVQSMQSIPIIIGGSVLFGTVLGYTALHEMLTYRGWIGVGLIAVGIALVGTDPGGAGGVHG